MTIPAFTEKPKFNQPDNGLRDATYRIHVRRAGMATADYIVRIDAGEKWCSKCTEWKPKAEFREGSSYCTECRGK